MRVTFEMTKKDLRHCYAFFRRRSIFGLPFTLIFWGFILLISLYAGVQEAKEGDFMITFIAFVLIFGIFPYLAMLLLRLVTAAYYFSRSEYIQGEHTIEIELSGVKVWYPIGVYSVSWEGVREVVEDKRGIYLLVGRQGGLFVPRRSFSSNEEARNFLDTAGYYKGASTQA